jgi:hypothetical protein
LRNSRESSKSKPKEWNVTAWAALFVSIVAVGISGLSAYYAYVQSEILKQNNLPDIEVTAENEVAPDFSSTRSVTVKNNGGPLSNFNAQAIYVLNRGVSFSD